jgi:hypothetical protein
LKGGKRRADDGAELTENAHQVLRQRPDTHKVGRNRGTKHCCCNQQQANRRQYERDGRADGG